MAPTMTHAFLTHLHPSFSHLDREHWTLPDSATGPKSEDMCYRSIQCMFFLLRCTDLFLLIDDDVLVSHRFALLKLL